MLSCVEYHNYHLAHAFSSSTNESLRYASKYQNDNRYISVLKPKLLAFTFASIHAFYFHSYYFSKARYSSIGWSVRYTCGRRELDSLVGSCQNIF